MATVYLARLVGEHGFERTVALKLLREDLNGLNQYEKMFVDEARVSARLSHPNLIQIYDLGRDEEGQLYMAMELLLGRSLAEVWDACREHGVRLRGDVVAWIGARVAEGLAHAHATDPQLVHRDVSPSNVVITFDGHVKLIDFGLVRATDRLSQTENGVVKGKLAYLSPEQVIGRPVDRRSDVYSLGVTLWELSSDRRLFRQDADEETIRRIREGIIEDPTTFVPDYPSLLWLVLRRALAPNPDERYRTAGDLARDLDGVARAQGAILQAATLAEMMNALFGEHVASEFAWVKSMQRTNLAEPLRRPIAPLATEALPPTKLPPPNVPFLVPTGATPLPPPIPTPEPTLVRRREPNTARVIALVILLVVTLFAVSVLLTRLLGR